MAAHTRPLTPAEIASVPDGKIDFDDIPELDSDFWREAELSRPDRTEQITMRVKRSVLDYFRAPGRGYQTRINRVLESYVRAQGGS
ncbi:MAG: BrnA antitoxin family protein [Alphaproteobacteria bacterium]|nr:BrnA antitoxin family protein [Alphaproteobacteria bacterium]